MPDGREPSPPVLSWSVNLEHPSVFGEYLFGSPCLPRGNVQKPGAADCGIARLEVGGREEKQGRSAMEHATTAERTTC